MRRFLLAAKRPVLTQVQAGASLTEFLLVLPLLGGLLYAAHLLHDVIEHRHVLRIASRNTLHSLASAGDAFNNFSNQASPVHRDVWEANAQRQQADSSADWNRIEAFVDVPDSSSWSEISQAMGWAAANGGKLLDGIQNAGIGDKTLLIPSERWSIRASLLTTKNHPLAKPVDRFLSAFDETWSLTLRDQVFHRPEVGYHPDPYQYQALIGVIVGGLNEREHWHTPAQREDEIVVSASQTVFSAEVEEGFTKECMMNFIANSKCGYEPENTLAVTIRTIGVVKGVIQTILDYLSGSSTNALNQAADEATKELADVLVDEIVDQAKEKVIKAASDKAKEAVAGDFESFRQDFHLENGHGDWMKVFAHADDKLESGSEN